MSYNLWDQLFEREWTCPICHSGLRLVSATQSWPDARYECAGCTFIVRAVTIKGSPLLMSKHPYKHLTIPGHIADRLEHAFIMLVENEETDDDDAE